MRKEGDIEYAQIRIDTCTLKFIEEFHRRKKLKKFLQKTFLQSFHYHVFVVLDNFLCRSSYRKQTFL